MMPSFPTLLYLPFCIIEIKKKRSWEKKKEKVKEYKEAAAVPAEQILFQKV